MSVDITSTQPSFITSTVVPDNSGETDLDRQCYGQIDGFRELKENSTSQNNFGFLLCISNCGYRLSCPVGTKFNSVVGFCILVKFLM